jgi:hypothetical protein
MICGVITLEEYTPEMEIVAATGNDKVEEEEEEEERSNFVQFIFT